MTARIHPLEKLAREICWAGFVLPKKVGTTKARYWKRIPEETRAEYRTEAERFAYLMGRIDVNVLNAVSGMPLPTAYQSTGEK